MDQTKAEPASASRRWTVTTQRVWMLRPLRTKERPPAAVVVLASGGGATATPPDGNYVLQVVWGEPAMMMLHRRYNGDIYVPRGHVKTSRMKKGSTESRLVKNSLHE